MVTTAPVPVRKVSGATVRADTNADVALGFYRRTAERVGLWASEASLMRRYLPDTSARLLEAGCGAGRATLGLWAAGYRDIVAFDFAEKQLALARDLARANNADAIRFVHADATRRLPMPHGYFDAALFLFCGLMQIPGRAARRRALANLAHVTKPGGTLILSFYDRADEKPADWSKEVAAWAEGRQDPRLHELGDRYIENECGAVFVHIVDGEEFASDLRVAGWTPMRQFRRKNLARENAAVRSASDECRFIVARRNTT